MLSYQHGYHAGNFADVVKHVTLSRLLNYLIQKQKPLFYLETHSGRGLYNLTDYQALKTREASAGVQLLWNSRHELPPSFDIYIKTLHQLNAGGELKYYPGSPYFALQMLRPIDRLYCCELHPREFESLQTIPRHGKRIFYSHCNGLTQLQALLPPPERRGLIFIDPTYEIKTDYRLIPELLKKAHHQFETGMYCAWYPLVDKKYSEQLKRGFEKIHPSKQLLIEFELSSDWGQGMRGCGLYIINPPYLLKNELKSVLQACCKLFNPPHSSYSITD